MTLLSSCQLAAFWSAQSRSAFLHSSFTFSGSDSLHYIVIFRRQHRISGEHMT